MAAHVTTMWPYAEAWHMAPSSQPVPRKGAVRARSCGPARAGLFLRTRTVVCGYSRQKLGVSTGVGVAARADACCVVQTRDGRCASHVEA